MAEEKKKVKSKNGKVVWIILVLVVLVVVSFVIYRVVSSDDETSISEQVELNGDYNAQLQEIQSKIDEKEESINKLNEEMLPLLEERTNLEQQLIELSGESE